MQNITIWHNAKCSKSRQALEFLQNKDLNIKVLEYMNETFSEDDLKEVLNLLDIKAHDLLRIAEDLYSKLKLNENDSEEKLIKTMLSNPSLIQRPIIIKNNKAVISRPFSKLEELLND